MVGCQPLRWVVRVASICATEVTRVPLTVMQVGEVALIVASKGEALGLMGTQLMGPVVIVVIITTIIAPILLKPVFKMGPASVPSDNNKLAEGFEQIAKIREHNER